MFVKEKKFFFEFEICTHQQIPERKKDKTGRQRDKMDPHNGKKNRQTDIKTYCRWIEKLQMLFNVTCD